MIGSLMASVALAGCFAYFVYRLAYRRFFNLASEWPGPKPYPVFGNALDFLGPSDRIFERLVRHLDHLQDLGRLWIGPRLLIFLFHPADAEIILNSYEYLDKAIEYDFLRPWIGNGLLTSTGEKWKAHRRAIAPSFHLTVLKRFMKQFNENARSLVLDLDKLSGNTFDAHAKLSTTITRTLLETVMGVEIGPNEKKLLQNYGPSVRKLSDIIHFRQVKVWLGPDVLFNLSHYASAQKKLIASIHNLSQKMLSKKSAEVESKSKIEEVAEKPSIEHKSSEESPTSGFSYGQAAGLLDDLDSEIAGERKKLPFLEALIEKALNKEIFTFQEVHEQLDTIMFEGHDSASTTSCMFLCSLASRPDIQEKCYDELHRIFGGAYRDITFQDTNDMKYLERCLLETLRLYPPVPVMARQVTKDIKIATRDLTIPSGSTVLVATYALHRRADIYPNPNEFNPDNFLPEKSIGRHFYSYIPFSAGPRSCVGRKYVMLELKTILATIIWNFKIKPVVPEEDWKFSADLVLKRRDGYKIGIERRQMGQ